MRYILLVVIALLSGSSQAFAWGDEGHRIICEIAYRLAQPDTRAAIRKLIRADQEFDTFSGSCVYPDHPRKRASEHFVNLPRNGAPLQSDECPAADKCVLTAILNDAQLLGASTTKKADRLIALKFLGHWVGDIHQPLHVSFEDDRGGNTIHVTGQCSGNMHAAWDTCLVEHAVGPDPQEAATDLIATITPEMVTKWSASNPRQWANESFAISEAVTTGYCVMHGNSCDKPNGDVEITPDYLNANETAVREQLQKAGVRLSKLLDQAFAD
jgi:nuclease S1